MASLNFSEMPSVWSKLSDFWTWFLWGKRTYSDLDAEKKKEARRENLEENFKFCSAVTTTHVFIAFQNTYEILFAPL